MSVEAKFFFINLDKISKERFDLGRFMEFNIDNYDPLTSNFLFQIKNLPLGGVYTVQGEDGRPDLLSYSVYGDTQYWWILMAYNGFNSVDQIHNGEQIKFPKVAELEDLYFTLKINQNKADA